MSVDIRLQTWKSPIGRGANNGRRWQVTVSRRQVLRTVALGTAVGVGGCLPGDGSSDPACGPGHPTIEEVFEGWDRYATQELTVTGVVIGIEPSVPELMVDDGSGVAAALDVRLGDEEEVKELWGSCVSVSGTLPADRSRYDLPSEADANAQPAIVLIEASWEME